jgi:ABC-2 type transport system permease protein
VLLLSACLAASLVALAFTLQSRRDVGSGVIERSTGPAGASPALHSSWALAWRQHRTAWLAWLIGGVVWSLLFGSLANAVADIASTSSQIQVILERMGGSQMITQMFIGTAVGMIAMIVAFFIAQALLRARDEEATGRVDLLLSAPVRRTTWLAGHVVAAYAGIATIMLACGAAIGLTASLASPDASFARVVGTAAAHIPALWIIAGACLCVLGWLPRHSALMWVIIGVALSISMFGQVLNAPDWVLNISPFSTAPAVTDAPFAWTTLGLHLVIAAALTVTGAIGVRRRDLGT